MIRSASPINPRWQPVPRGFRVAWGAVDFAIFAHRSRVVARVVSALRGMACTVTAVRIGWHLLWWRASARARGARRFVAQCFPSLPYTILGGPPASPRQRWNLVVRITVDRGSAEEPQRLAA